MQNPDNMTGAELQTLREACNLSRDELATLAGVAARTVKHWENGRAGVPADVAALVADIDGIITREVHTTAQHAMQWAREGGRDGNPVRPAVLVLYGPESWPKWHHLGGFSALPVGVASALVSRCRLLMQAGESGKHAMPVRVVRFDESNYLAWLKLAPDADDPGTLQRWAAEQVTAQAIPHRADQPPT